MGEDDTQLAWPRDTQWPTRRNQADGEALIRRELRPLVLTINKAIERADGQLMLRSVRKLIAQTETRGSDRWLWAAAQQELGDVLLQIPVEDHEQSLDQAIIAYKAALSVYSPDVCPVEWATTQNNLGNIYWKRSSGDPADNIEQAIAAYKAALQVRTQATDPYGWARTQNNLGNAYAQRHRGQKAENQELAIAAYQAALQVHSVEIYDVDYAMDQTNLGLTYHERINGVYAENLEQAMVCFLCAMLVYTPETSPRRYRRLVNSLSDAFYARIEAAAPEVREQVLAALGPVVQIVRTVERLQRTPPLPQLSTPAGHDLSQFARAQSTDIPAPSLFARYYRDYYHAMPLPLLMDMISSLQQPEEIPNKVELLRIALSRADVLAPSLRATLNIQLGAALTIPTAHVVGDQEEAIAAFEAALAASHPQEDLEQWASIHILLAEAYGLRVADERAENIERALGYCEALLNVHLREAHPKVWALGQTQVGRLYRDRVLGDRGENSLRAVAAFEAALTVFTRTSDPYVWARTQNALGLTYKEMQHGDNADLVERAITAFEEALTVLTRTAYPYEWAGTEVNLANTLQDRIKGNKAENIERAITAYTASLSVWTRTAFPIEWAGTQRNLGGMYHYRLRGNRTQNLQQSAAAFRAALEVHTVEALPAEHHHTAQSLADVESERGNWLAAHEAYVTARAAEDLLLVAVGTGVHGFDAIVKQGYEAASKDSFALAQLGRLDEACVAIERGRARWLSASVKLDEASPELIQDPLRRQRYCAARDALIAALSELHAPQAGSNDPRLRGGSEGPEDASQRRETLQKVEAFRRAREHFDTVVDDIRRASDPADFLRDDLDAATIVKVAACASGHALVYLVATRWGGLALAALGSDSQPRRFVSLKLPELTDVFVGKLVQISLNDGSGRIFGGYGSAQEGIGLNWISGQWPGATFTEKAAQLHTTCVQARIDSTLDAAAQDMLGLQLPALQTIVQTPLERLDRGDLQRLGATLDHAFLQCELDRCLKLLAKVALRPTIAWLQELGVTSLTLVPCGMLAAFPLLAAPMNDVPVATDWQTVADVLPTSIAPSARSLLQRGQHTGTRSGVYALGDPWPTQQELRWGEAEARTLAQLGGDSTHMRVHESATRDWFIEVLRRGLVVDASCHGQFDAFDFLRSRLLLANNETLSLGDALGSITDLSGLRLLILSACQTAILDLRGASDEVRSIAATMLQAGAQAVIAALWAVDDRATYLLIVRFAQEWLPVMGQEPPAKALARAQRWLRTVTNEKLQKWEAVPTVQSLAAIEHGELQAVAKAPEQQLAVVRGRGERYAIAEAEQLIQGLARRKQGADRDECPYADPIYWAGFQVHGW